MTWYLDACTLFRDFTLGNYIEYIFYQNLYKLAENDMVLRCIYIIQRIYMHNNSTH